MKKWIKTNLNKITLALALLGATNGTIGLIIGGVLSYNTNSIFSYEKSNHSIVYGKYPIWVDKTTLPYLFILYFSKNKLHAEDIKWDGKYPKDYFDWN